ncbi:MAG: PH domain-containing protein [Actinomycetota bacterium]
MIGVIGEFAEGAANFVLGIPIAALGIFLFGRFATVRVSKVGDSGAKIRNPFRTHLLDCGEIASIRVSGFVYKWLTLQTRDGRKVPVAASFFVLEPRGPNSLALNKFLEKCAQQPQGKSL